MRITTLCALALLFFALTGCGSKPDGNKGGDPPAAAKSPATKSAAAAKAELLETAKKMEGRTSAAVVAYVDAVENGTWAWSTADDAFATGKFTPETIAAYKRWRTAKLAEAKK